MQFNSFVQSLLDEMAKVKVSDLSNWPSYTHPEFGDTSSVFQNKYGKKYTPDQLQTLIKNAVLEISKDPNLAEIEDKDLAAELVKAFRSGSMSPTTSDVISKRAVKQLLDFLKSQPNSSKQAVAQTVAVTAKAVEQKPEQAVQIATQAAQDTAQVVAQAQPEPEKKTEETPTTSGGGEAKEVTDIFDQEFSMVEELYDKVVEDVAALNKRASKKGIPLITVDKTGEEAVEKRYDPTKVSSRRGIMLKKIKFRIKVPQLQLPGGWKFIGRVDHTDIGNLIVSVPDSGHEEDLHKLYGNSQPSFCDHCNTTRRRTSTFVVQDAQGKLKRIGRQCLKDYLPGGEQGVKKMLDFADYLSKIAEGLKEWESKGGEGDYDSEGGGGGGGSRYNNFRIKETLGVALAYVRRLGYVSRSKANADNESGGYSEPTSSKIVKGITGELEDIIARAGGLAKAGGGAQAELAALDDYRENKEKYEAEADKVIEWGKEYITKQLERPSNMTEYFKNLQTILNGAASSGAIPEKYIGYLVSIIPAYTKAIDAQDQEKLSKERGEQVSNYVGTVGGPIGELSYNDKRKLKKMGVEGLENFPYNGPIKVTVTGSRGFERQGFGYYDTGGTTTMINMIDDQGNVYVYFASGSEDVEKGHKMIIRRALVKNQKEYTNKQSGKVTKQTVLSRAVLEDAPTSESVSFADYYNVVAV
jgi:hypothetical protein